MWQEEAPALTSLGGKSHSGTLGPFPVEFNAYLRNIRLCKHICSRMCMLCARVGHLERACMGMPACPCPCRQGSQNACHARAFGGSAINW